MSGTLASRKVTRQARLAGLLRNRPQVGPQTVHFDIANGCNTRCTTCWHHSPHLLPQHQRSAAWKRQQLAFGTFRAVFDDLLRLGGLEQIILSGMGEPFLNREIYEMVDYAHRHGVGVTIITNLLLADLPRLLASAGELDLLVSVCGVTPEVWQAFHAHPQPNGFDRLLTQLAFLREQGFRPKQVQVINRQNAHQLGEMVRFATTYPVKRVNFKFASLQRGTESMALTAAEKETLREQRVPEAIALARILGVATDLTAFRLQIDPSGHGTAPIEQVGCFMGFLYARVTVDLALLYCCNTTLQVGTISTTTPFSSLWAGAAYQATRDALRAGRYFAGCHQCGKFKQNLKWSEKLRSLLAPDAFRALLGGAPPDAEVASDGPR